LLGSRGTNFIVSIPPPFPKDLFRWLTPFFLYYRRFQWHISIAQQGQFLSQVGRDSECLRRGARRGGGHTDGHTGARGNGLEGRQTTEHVAPNKEMAP